MCTVGAPADFLLLRGDSPELGIGDLASDLVYAASGSVVAAADFDVRDIVSSLEPWRGAAERFVKV